MVPYTSTRIPTPSQIRLQKMKDTMLTSNYKRKISVSELSRYLSSIHGRTESKMDKASPTQALAIFTGLGFSNPRPSIFAFANRTDFSDWVAGPYTNPCLGLDPKGFYPSVRTSTLQMLVDSQHAASAFYYPAGSLSKLIDTYEKCFKTSPEKLPPGDLQSFLSGLRVSYSYLKDKVTKRPVTKFRKVRGIAPGRLNSEKVTFDIDGREVTVAEHFKSKSNPFPVCHSLLIDVSDREIILKAPTLQLLILVSEMNPAGFHPSCAPCCQIRCTGESYPVI